MPLNKMKLIDLKRKYLESFTNKRDLNLLLTEIVGYENLNSSDFLLNRFMLNKFRLFYKKYKKGIPIAYITKHIYFYNININIRKKVFIPRIDSETMIEKIINDNNLENKNVIDICCGTGALGLSLKKAKNINLTLVEKYRIPFNICKKNSKLFDGVKCFRSDYISLLTNSKNVYDIIIINPPYIDIKDKDIDESVIKYEPHTALFAKNNGLWYYEKLKENLLDIFNISKNAIFYIEFGWKQKEEINKLFKNVAKIDFYKDYNNNWRYFTLRNN